jgi:hydroxymethylbilane synthase
MKKILRLGSRGSPLALLQAEEARKKILAAHPGMDSETDIEIVPIRTKELFTKEIEDALLEGHIDMAIHSMKDVASWLPGGLEIAAILERADPREAFIGRAAHTLLELPPDAAVGTSSVRRQAQVLALRPDLRIVPLRGNVETRLKKLADGQADAILLALAGLARLGLQDRISSIVSPKDMLPAAAQGAAGIEIRSGDDETRRLLERVNARETHICVQAERSLLRKLDGSCATPIGALAVFTGADHITLEGMIAKPDGTSVIRMSASGPASAAEALGAELGGKMKGRLPPDFYAA